MNIVNSAGAPHLVARLAPLTLLLSDVVLYLFH